MQKTDLEAIGGILKSGLSLAVWNETRGNKQKYFFHLMQKGEIRRKEVKPEKARSIQSSMKQAANRQGIFITIQNHGNYLLIKRTK